MATRGSNTGEQSTVPPQVVDDLLSVDTRQRALTILEERDEPLIVRDLATAVIAAQKGCPESAVSDSERDELRSELFTEHIPKLLATGVLEYDSMVGTVELTDAWLVNEARD